MTIRFSKGDFQAELQKRVNRYFKLRGISKRDRPSMYVKAIVIVGWAAISYAFLVFGSVGLGWAIVLALSLALSLVGVGFNIQHDGNHSSFSERVWVNRLAGLTLDFIGDSSYFWKKKHNTQHHTYTNVAGEDHDIELWPLGRLSPAQRPLWFHRYQHWYLWSLYTMVHLKSIYSEARRLIFRRERHGPVRWPKGRDLAEYIAGKLAFVILAFAVPLAFHPFGTVMGFFVGISLVMGFIFSVVFQLAHMIDLVEHPGRIEGTVEHEFVIHQLETTANFAPRSRFLTVCLGGLNFQREHHLFHDVSHVHYPALSRIVKRVCRKHGVTFHEHKSFWSAIRSHYRFLKQMGRPALSV